jgi:hypothetical protein
VLRAWGSITEACILNTWQRVHPRENVDEIVENLDELVHDMGHHLNVEVDYNAQVADAIANPDSDSE